MKEKTKEEEKVVARKKCMSCHKKQALEKTKRQIMKTWDVYTCKHCGKDYVDEFHKTRRKSVKKDV